MKNGQNYLGSGKDCRESLTGVIFRKEGRWLGETSINLPMTKCLADPAALCNRRTGFVGK